MCALARPEIGDLRDSPGPRAETCLRVSALCLGGCGIGHCRCRLRVIRPGRRSIADRALASQLRHDADYETFMLCELGREPLALGVAPHIRDVLVGAKINDESVHGFPFFRSARAVIRRQMTFLSYSRPSEDEILPGQCSHRAAWVRCSGPGHAEPRTLERALGPVILRSGAGHDVDDRLGRVGDTPLVAPSRFPGAVSGLRTVTTMLRLDPCSCRAVKPASTESTG